MYQFYYADIDQKYKSGVFKDNINHYFKITAVRPTMWEEHCLECSAPFCYQNCLHYTARSDGRCKRFANSFLPFRNNKACCGQGVHIKFRKWANMMTIIFPAMIPLSKYQKIFEENEKLGNWLKKIIDSKLPQNTRWQVVRAEEYLRRRKLKGMKTEERIPDAFVFHGFSYHAEPYKLVIEIYDNHTPLDKTSLPIVPGENIFVLNQKQLSAVCWTPNNLVKVYPENNLEVELDILWCDFVQGKPVRAEKEKTASQVKCVVWDLDNTLWNGTLIEMENPEELQLNKGIREFIQKLDQRGILQSVASKNDMDMAWPILERLGIAEYFFCPQIHWNAKSGSIEKIAENLNIGIDTLAFIDDSKFEREQVRSVWPQVRVYDVRELSDLLNRTEFSITITEESKNRRAMYRAEEKRNQWMLDENKDIITFLKKCNLQIEIFTPKTNAEILRCYELTVRTNQLNMSGKKYSQKEFENILNRIEYQSFAFSCKDDFGEYGIVGFGQYYIEQKELMFTEFAMSCRVAGKYIESALFEKILKKEHCDVGKFCIQKTKKNSLLRRSLEEAGFSVVSDDEKKITYCFSAGLKNNDVVIADFREKT